MRLRSALFFAFLLSLSVGCGDDTADLPDATLLDGGALDGGGGLDAAPPVDAAPADGGATDAGPELCPREPAAADRERFVVLAHPFVPSYEVLALAIDGTLTRTGETFLMGSAVEAPIGFTADGEVGVVAQDDGTLGVFRLDAAGEATVVHAAYAGDFYAAQVVMDPSGESAWVLDAQWRENGGGLYRVDFGCDGSIVREELVAAARLPYGMAFAASGEAIVAAKDILDTTLGPDLHRVDLAEPAVRASADVFADADWIGAGFALGASEQHAFMSDNAAFSAEPNRVAVVSLGATPAGVQTLEVEDPASIVPSPFDDAVLVVSALGDAIFQYGYDPDAATPLTPIGELAYATRGPALPTVAVGVARGGLEGLVLVAENVAIRRIRFEGGGVVTDLGPLELGTGVESIAGAIGVQP